MWWDNIEVTDAFKELLNDEKDPNGFIKDTKAIIEMDQKSKIIEIYSDPTHHPVKILIGTLKIEDEEFDLCDKMISEKSYKTALLHMKSPVEIVRHVAKGLLDGTNIVKRDKANS